MTRFEASKKTKSKRDHTQVDHNDAVIEAQLRKFIANGRIHAGEMSELPAINKRKKKANKKEAQCADTVEEGCRCILLSKGAVFYAAGARWHIHLERNDTINAEE